MHSYLKVNNKKVGNSFPAYIIAEVGQTHCGSFKKALSYIKLIADTGADAVKFQTHFASEESTLDEPFSCLLYTSPSPRDLSTSRMPSSA